MNLFVGNLYRGTTEQALKEYFEQCGTVTSVRIINDRITGQSRGFAFVTMGSDEEAKAVIERLNNQPFDGRPLRIAEAQEQERRAPRGDRFGGGDNNGGGYNRGDRDRGGSGGFGGGFGGGNRRRSSF